MNKMWAMVSFVLFCIGLVLAVIGGLALPANATVSIILAILGLIIGLIYVTAAKEINTLLLATIALLAMAGAFAPITFVGKAITSMVTNFAALMAPVAVIAAIKALLKIGLEK